MKRLADAIRSNLDSSNIYKSGLLTIDTIYGKTVKLILVVILAFGIVSCSDEDIAVMPELPKLGTVNGVDPSEFLDAQRENEDGVRSLPVILTIDLECPVQFTVQPPEPGGTDYVLTGEGEGVSNVYGPFQVLINLTINSETGSTEGVITYQFAEPTDALQFAVTGEFSDWEFAEYSELTVEVLEGSGIFSGVTGSGDTFVLGNIFHDMQAQNIVSAFADTSADLEIL